MCMCTHAWLHNSDRNSETITVLLLTKQPTLKPVYFIIINNLICHYNFLFWKIFLYEKFQANEHVHLNIHRFCSIDNRLCMPITDNWWLTHAMIQKMKI